MTEHAEAENNLSVAQRQSAKFWELRAAMSMARLWRDQDKCQQAYGLLAPVYPEINLVLDCMEYCRRCGADVGALAFECAARLTSEWTN
jgi:hypothetical protein